MGKLTLTCQSSVWLYNELYDIYVVVQAEMAWPKSNCKKGFTQDSTSILNPLHPNKSPQRDSGGKVVKSKMATYIFV